MVVSSSPNRTVTCRCRTDRPRSGAGGDYRTVDRRAVSVGLAQGLWDDLDLTGGTHQVGYREPLSGSDSQLESFRA